jgi:hypothetical protein
MKKHLLRLTAAALLAGSALHANAALYTTTFGSQVPGYYANDDVAFGPIDLGFSLNLFGQTYSDFYVSNNGLLSFGRAITSYTPTPLNQETNGVIVAPYWTDLISGGPDPSTGVYLSQTADQTIVTWNSMGYCCSTFSGTATFQTVLNRNGQIGFYYGDMSAGTDGHRVSAGFGDGQSDINPGEISSATGFTQTIAPQLNQSQFLFSLSDNGVPENANVPEPASLALIGLGMLGVAFKRKRNS